MNLQEKLKQLEAVAENATPGKWETGHGCSGRMIKKLGYGEIADVDTKENSMYIATFNPDLVKRLLKVVDELILQRDFLAETIMFHVENAYISNDGNEKLLKILEGE